MNRLPIQKTERCLSAEELLRYVMDALPAEQRRLVESHLAACLYCLTRLGEVHRLADTARQEACVRVRRQLPSYLRAKIEGYEIEEVRTHLLVCQDCFERYDQLVEEQMQAEWEQWVPGERQTTVSRVVEMVLGLIRNFPALSPRWVPGVPAVRPAAQGGDPGPPGVDNWQELVGEGITATLALDARDHLLVALESDRYMTGHVRVSLGRKTETGMVEVTSVVTDPQGQGDFGPVTAIPRPDHDGYLLVLQGLSRRSGPKGEEDRVRRGEMPSSDVEDER
jgi:hypothetical protein